MSAALNPFENPPLALDPFDLRSNPGDDGRADSLDDGIAAAKPAKPRKQRPRLTAETLLEPRQGLSYLRTQGPKIRFEGKGHEAEDLNRLIRFYKGWAHELFPRAPFKEFVYKSQKLCRDRRMRAALEGMYHEFRFGTSGTALSGETVGDEVGEAVEQETGSHSFTENQDLDDLDRALEAAAAENMQQQEQQQEERQESSAVSEEQLLRIQQNRERALARVAERKRQRELEEAEELKEAEELEQQEEEDAIMMAALNMPTSPNQQVSLPKEDIVLEGTASMLTKEPNSKEPNLVAQAHALLEEEEDGDEEVDAWMPEISFLSRKEGNVEEDTSSQRAEKE